MTTKIELKEPYKSKWRYGYIVTNKENRKTLILYNSPNDRTSTQYARYIMATHIKRFLTDEETVDHIDNDKTNDNINNLQLLTLSENIIKANKQPDITLICPICKITFTRSLSQLRGRKHKIKSNLIACSRKCGGVLSHRT